VGFGDAARPGRSRERHGDVGEDVSFRFASGFYRIIIIYNQAMAVWPFCPWFGVGGDLVGKPRNVQSATTLLLELEGSRGRGRPGCGLGPDCLSGHTTSAKSYAGSVDTGLRGISDSYPVCKGFNPLQF
jgi:hypothetical protein